MASTTQAVSQRFVGKVILVTGGAAGIGEAICRRFVKEGGTVRPLVCIDGEVIVADINGDGAEKVARELSDLGPGKAIAYGSVDVSDEEQVRVLVDHITAEHSYLDVLVNNAARFILKAAEDATPEDWDNVLGPNVKGAAFAIKHAVRVMKEKPGNDKQLSPFVAQENLATYSVTKAAILQLTRCTAVDVAKYGIRCNAVCPGPILTEATKRHAESVGTTVDGLMEDMVGCMILHRMGHVDEVAAAVAFLASHEASFITGSSLMVDGGYTTR